MTTAGENFVNYVEDKAYTIKCEIKRGLKAVGNAISNIPRNLRLAGGFLANVGERVAGGILRTAGYALEPGNLQFALVAAGALIGGTIVIVGAGILTGGAAAPAIAIFIGSAVGGYIGGQITDRIDPDKGMGSDDMRMY